MACLLYTVQPEDELRGLEGIAQWIYGDAEHWTVLYEANRYLIGNNPAVVRPGQQLIVPCPGQIPVLANLPRGVYAVQPSDLDEGLAGIARRIYGVEERWRQISALNRGVLGDDPLALRPGQCLILP